MYIIRDIFQLKFGHYKEVKAIFDEAQNNGLFSSADEIRVLTDFTGGAYRLILEQGHNTLAEYEQSLTQIFSDSNWNEWYGQFKQHVESSNREILKLLINSKAT